MSEYHPLARKWRPNKFSSFVGQDLVVNALSYALDNNSVHHAYLFTGTRGVGKTSIGRLLAKCLNCEKGVSSKPCNKCSACLSIDQGNFIDLIEIDAASKTKVEDTRELIDNIQYSPSAGRYKVYLIDEVHMLSAHSFNALLKTLEEPPAHVKFILATTDPQKLPETILSRAMGFNLREISVANIQGHLAKILTEEKIKFNLDALLLIAQCARGSMRDALTLTDRIIANGEGEVDLKLTQDVLGVASNSLVLKILEMIFTGNGAGLLDSLHTDFDDCVDFVVFLDSCAKICYQIAIKQHVLLHKSGSNNLGNKLKNKSVKNLDSQISKLAVEIPAECVQMLYQALLRGKEEILLAPSARVGFEMLCLRWVNFVIISAPSDLSNKLLVSSAKVSEIKESNNCDLESNNNVAVCAEGSSLDSGNWKAFVGSLLLSGVTKQIMANAEFISLNNGGLNLRISSSYSFLLSDKTKNELVSLIKQKQKKVFFINFVTKKSDKNSALDASEKNKISGSNNPVNHNKSEAISSSAGYDKPSSQTVLADNVTQSDHVSKVGLVNSDDQANDVNYIKNKDQMIDVNQSKSPRNVSENKKISFIKANFNVKLDPSSVQVAEDN